MSCILYPSPVFGPIHSRRLGVSLGVNLLPATAKKCSFDCIYCECGFNADHKSNEKFPTKEKVFAALEEKLQNLKKEGVELDVFTFAGNGEPTSHPDFLEIIKGTRLLRDRYYPKAKISVLSNSTFIRRPHVFEALKLVDNNILKLDTVSQDYIERVDRPNAHYDVREVIEGMKAFRGDLIIQSIFVDGESGGTSVCNTGEEFVGPWLAAVKEIAPREVMIYTIDRETPDKGLKKTAPAVLDAIAERVRALGIPVKVAY
jgi:wyosine [tRNA(Phe)-imidazoG37] synthetase (radical SAM superfamily)